MSPTQSDKCLEEIVIKLNNASVLNRQSAMSEAIAALTARENRIILEAVDKAVADALSEVYIYSPHATAVGVLYIDVGDEAMYLPDYLAQLTNNTEGQGDAA